MNSLKLGDLVNKINKNLDSVPARWRAEQETYVKEFFEFPEQLKLRTYP